jgi:hypothetical protein
MSLPQALILYAGVRALLSGSFTLSHGVTPSTCTLYIAPQSTVMPTIGTLVLSYGPTRINFPDCRVAHCDMEVSESGIQTWALTIEDTRWRWKRGVISGEYNLRRADGEPRPETIRTPKQLLTLLFEACGVTDGVDLSQVPNNTLPEKVWEVAPAAGELARLCDELGCRVVLQPGNRIKVCRSGLGANLPLNSLVLDNSLSLQPADRPDKLMLVGGVKRYQLDLLLSPIGKDLDGTIKPIDALSYKPVGGWEVFDFRTGNGVKAGKARELALKWVFRVFTIPAATFFDGEWILRDRFLPLTSKLVTTEKIDGVEEAEPAFVYGLFNPGHANPVNNVDAVTSGDVIGRPVMKFNRGFSINEDRGWVEFQDPVYATTPWIEAIAGRTLKHPQIYLRTAVGIRDEVTRAWRRHTQVMAVPGPKNGSLPEVIRHDDIVAKLWQVWSGGNRQLKDNRAEVEAMCDHYLLAELDKWKTQTPGTITYAGFQGIAPDGAIQQVAWYLSDKGEPRTRASRNRDDPAAGLTYERRRFEEKVLAMLGEHPGAADPRRGRVKR